MHGTASSCSRCNAPFAPSELSLAKDGSGLVCDACAIRADMPDVHALLRQDDRKKGYALVGLGVVLLAFAAWYAYELIGFVGTERDLGLDASVRPGPALAALAFGGTAVFFGVRLVWASRRPSTRRSAR